MRVFDLTLRKYYKTKLIELGTGFGPRNQGKINLDDFIVFKTRINYADGICRTSPSYKYIDGKKQRNCLNYKKVSNLTKFIL